MCRRTQAVGERWELNSQLNPAPCFLCADELPKFAAPLWVLGIWGWGLGFGFGFGFGFGLGFGLGLGLGFGFGLGFGSNPNLEGEHAHLRHRAAPVQGGR